MELHDRTVINADDLGISPLVNEAIFDAFDRAVVSSTTLLPTGPALDDACAGLRQRPALGVGIHLDTSEFEPITDEFKRFRGQRQDVDLRTVRLLRPAHLRTIGDEWLAQIDRILGLGVQPTHLDSHHFDHVNPVLFPQLVRVARASGVRRVRGMHNLSAGPVRPVVRSLKASHRLALRRAGLTTTTYMTDASTWLELAERNELPTMGTCEVMAHPGHTDYAAETASLLEAGGRLAQRPMSWASVL